MLHRDAKAEWIKGAPLFANLSKRDLSHVAHLADEIDLREGKEITRQGAPAREFFVLLEGEADVRKNGRRINQLGPGDFFGEIALLRDVPRTATVRALEPLRLYAIERDDFLTAVTGHDPTLAVAENVVTARLPAGALAG
jgi:CRP-like cAMP-binding protein